MRKIGFLAVLLVFGCAAEEEHLCRQYCNNRVLATSNDAEAKGCSIHKEELKEFKSKCLRTCSDVLDYVVEERYKPQAESCLSCINNMEDVPSGKALREIRETCFSECNNLGGYQFWYTFYISPPYWTCEEGWVIYY